MTKYTYYLSIVVVIMIIITIIMMMMTALVVVGVWGVTHVLGPVQSIFTFLSSPSRAP